MAHGMRVWGADGALQLDENSFTCRVVLSVVVTFPVPASVKYYQDFAVPGCNAGNSVAVVVPMDTYSSTAEQLETEMLTDVARVYNYTRTFAAGFPTSGTMRLNVIRFM